MLHFPAGKCVFCVFVCVCVATVTFVVRHISLCERHVTRYFQSTIRRLILRLMAYSGIIFVEGSGRGLRHEFFSGVQQIQLRSEDRENFDLRAVAP
jgi:hypothetical protein